MITLITGVPGSGKTLYGVSELLARLVGTTIADGKGKQVERVLFSNVPGLLLDHELIDKDAINTWHEWAKPGSVLDLDEIQDFWPVRPNGSKVPPYIEALATHRHMGVDIIVRTQHPMMIDQNLRALVGRHIHIRRVGNLPAAITYEWDNCSRQLLYSNAIAKGAWRFPRKAYAMYKSAEAHTKMPRKLPAILLAFPILIAAGFYVVPSTYASLTRSKLMTPEGPIDYSKLKPSSTKQPLVPLPLVPSSAPVVPMLPADSARAAPVRFGCIKVREICRCYDEGGARYQVDPGVCEALLEPAVPVLAAAASPVFPAEISPLASTSAEDLDVLAFMARSRRR